MLKGFWCVIDGEGFFYPSTRKHRTKALYDHLKKIAPKQGKFEMVMRAEISDIILSDKGYSFTLSIPSENLTMVNFSAYTILKGDNF